MLNDKDQELVAVGASIGAGCRPCTRFHFRAARAAGATDEEIGQAVSAALSVRTSATEIMARKARTYLGESPSGETIRCTDQSLVAELISVSAAFAANSVADLETHVGGARRQGATEGQIRTAVRIARAVKSMAGKVVEEAAVKAVRADEEGMGERGCASPMDVKWEQVQAAVAQAAEASRGHNNECGCHNET